MRRKNRKWKIREGRGTGRAKTSGSTKYQSRKRKKK